MANTYSPRVQAFRNKLIKDLPRAPNSKESLSALAELQTGKLILAFITWRMRLVPAKPRNVRFWSGGVLPSELKLVAVRLERLLKKVEAGDDLTQHLSNSVKTKGIVLPGANSEDTGKDIDGVLTRNGLHHFHIGPAGPDNLTGRSNLLVFAEVLEKEFRIIAISDHRAFEQGSEEQLRFSRISYAYIAKDVPPGQGFMANPVMSSGHSMVATFFADRCREQIELLDPQLDDAAFVEKLYSALPERNGVITTRPSKPKLSWHFEDLKFGILDLRTKELFCISPFYSR